MPLQLVDADVTCAGTFAASVKNFLIRHPDKTLVADEGKEWMLKHFDTESSEPGGQILERRTIQMSSTTMSFEMPSYYRYLVKDVTVFCSPSMHFGSAWGSYADGTVTVHSSTLGAWHILLMATRNDECALQCDRRIEYQRDLPEPAPQM